MSLWVDTVEKVGDIPLDRKKYREFQNPKGRVLESKFLSGLP
jgi:hypothetical protein